MKKVRRHLMAICFIGIFALLNVGLIHGQSIQFGKLTGQILLSSGEPLPGVAIEISSTALISNRTAVTSEKGTYVFLNLPIGKYTVKASLEGFKTSSQKNISISAASVTTVNLVMETGRIEEVVEVSAIAPVIDVKTSTVDTKINKDMLDKLPTSRDAFYDLSLSTPGMFNVGKDSSWLPSPSAYGGAANENVFLVNGVDTTNPRGGSFGSLVNVNYSAVQEVRVIALGSKAEYGSFSGVAIDVITKSGSNKLHGNLGFFSKVGTPGNNDADRNNLGDDWIFMRDGDNVFLNPITELEVSLTLGGPLVKNKLWFYAGVDYIESKFQEPFFDPYKTYKGRYFDFKLTGEAGHNHRAWVAYHFENNENLNENWGDIDWDNEAVYSSKVKTHSISAQWMWNVGGTTTFTAKYLGFWTDQDSVLPNNAPDHPAYVNWWKWIPKDMAVNGSFHAVEGLKASRQTIQADLSHYAEDFLGEHDMKFGVQFTRGRGDAFGGWFHGYANYAYPYGWTQTVQYLKSWYTWAGPSYDGLLMYVNQFQNDPYETSRAADSLGIFFDDQWSIGERLTLNIGLRYDKMTSKFLQGKVFNQPTSANITNPTVARTRQGSDNVFEFNTISPRIGLSYMLTKDAKTVFRASYGKYYSPIGVENLGNAGPDMDPVTINHLSYVVPWSIADSDGDGWVDGDNVVDATRALHDLTPYDSWSELSDPSYNVRSSNLKNQYTNQFTVSLERELAKDLSLQATYIHKETKNIIVRWPIDKDTGQDYLDLTNRAPYTTAEGVTFDAYYVPISDFDGNGVVDGADITRFYQNGNFEWRNLPDMNGKKARRLYQGFQVVLKKRYSNRWQMMASFLFSKSDGVAGRNKRQDQDISFEGPSTFGGDYWLGDFNQILNNMEGPLPFTPKFEFKFNASYRIPTIELDLGIRVRHQTGIPIWQVEELDGSQLPGERLFGWQSYMDAGSMPSDGFLLIAGAGQVVTTDVTDPYYLPSRTVFDLHVERAFKLGKSQLSLIVDLFNLFNDNTVTNVLIRGDAFGRVTGVPYPPRMIRFSALLEF